MLKSGGEIGGRLDLAKQNIKKLPKDIVNSEAIVECVINDNEFSRLEGFDQFRRLKKLQGRRNRLVKISGLSRLSELVELNLAENAIQSVENLKSLRLLEKLNLSGNNIKVFTLLNSNQKLRHVDLSNNGITSLSDISSLKDLQTLDLSKNIISTINTAPKCLPQSVVSLDLSENEIEDLCEISFLHGLSEMEYLGFAKNRCVSDLSCDYRPYAVNWCYKLKILDGKPISQQERLKAEWLFSQGQGRRFGPGSHLQLLAYLSRVDPMEESLDGGRKSDTISNAVREAWVARNGQRVTNLPSKKRDGQADDMSIEDVDKLDVSKDTTKIQSESVFIPVAETTVPANQEIEDLKIIQSVQRRLSSESSGRPLTAPSSGRNEALSDVDVMESGADDKNVHIDKGSSNVIASPLHQNDRPKTSPASASSVSKYEEYESRPCRPMSKQLMKELFDDGAVARNRQAQKSKQVEQRPVANKVLPEVTVRVPEKQSPADAHQNEAVSSVVENKKQSQPQVSETETVPFVGRLRRRARMAVPLGDSRLYSEKQSNAEKMAPTPEAVQNMINSQRISATTKIQAWWRGHLARKRLQPQMRILAFRRFGAVIASLVEMRKVDAAHIRRLEESLAERDRQEKKSRRLQTAAIKQLWEQVQSMKQQLAAANGTGENALEGQSTASDRPPSTTHDENISSTAILNAPLSSIVSDSARSLTDTALLSTEKSPQRRGSQNIDFGITRRSPYAVRQTFVVHGQSASPGKSQMHEDLNRAAAKSPLATPPRTRQATATSVDDDTCDNVQSTTSAGGEQRRMAIAAKFSYLPNGHQTNSCDHVNGGDGALTTKSGAQSTSELYDRVRKKLAYQH